MRNKNLWPEYLEISKYSGFFNIGSNGRNYFMGK
ncbi:hypothetical protein X927_05530 [Petrotoga mexicana DSM 14811]|uniref:Uncharacterized protein n=1 Tax=Petrotoga mexicana DSM 14811 TaxID=1122954 RepID=A0A2K1P9L4_9BACT|nr:hypothetical protein X927_05530 [Petrotoga mexicana DSM 14811]